MTFCHRRCRLCAACDIVIINNIKGVDSARPLSAVRMGYYNFCAWFLDRFCSSKVMPVTINFAHKVNATQLWGRFKGCSSPDALPIVVGPRVGFSADHRDGTADTELKVLEQSFGDVTRQNSILIRENADLRSKVAELEKQRRAS